MNTASEPRADALLDALSAPLLHCTRCGVEGTDEEMEAAHCEVCGGCDPRGEHVSCDHCDGECHAPRTPCAAMRAENEADEAHDWDVAEARGAESPWSAL